MRPTRQAHDKFLTNLGLSYAILENLQADLEQFPCRWQYDYWRDFLWNANHAGEDKSLMGYRYDEIHQLDPVHRLIWARMKGYTE